MRDINGTDHLDHGQKYSAPMASYLDALLLEGATADDSYADDVWSEGWFRFGRRVLTWDSQGFVYYHRLADETSARGFCVSLVPTCHHLTVHLPIGETCECGEFVSRPTYEPIRD